MAGVDVTRNAGYRVLLLRSQSAEGKSALASSRLELTPEMKEEGYALVLSQQHAAVVGATSAGIFYGVQTLRQLLCADKRRQSCQLARCVTGRR